MLSDLEREKIIVFNKDPDMKEAVRKVLLAAVYSNGTLKKDEKADPLKNGALGLAFLALNGRAVVSNEQLGEDLRAYAQGVNLLETGFKQLEKVTKDEEPQEDEGLKEAI